MNGASNDENILNSIEQVDKNYTIFYRELAKVAKTASFILYTQSVNRNTISEIAA